MHTAVKRVIFYVMLAWTCYGIATLFADSQAVFVAVFATGLLIALFAELMLWRHLFRVFSRRRTH